MKINENMDTRKWENSNSSSSSSWESNSNNKAIQKALETAKETGSETMGEFQKITKGETNQNMQTNREKKEQDELKEMEKAFREVEEMEFEDVFGYGGGFEEF